MPSPQRFSRVAAFYDLSMRPTERAVRSLRADLLSRARGRVLEIGVGTGASLPWYPKGCQVVGVDPSAAMLARARERARGLGLAFDAVEQTVEALELRPSSFDTVVFSLTLCSVERPEVALEKARRLLRPGGKLLLVEHVRPQGPLGPVADALNVVWSRLVCRLNQRSEELVRQAGFEVRYKTGRFATFFLGLEAEPVAPSSRNQPTSA